MRPAHLRVGGGKPPVLAAATVLSGRHEVQVFETPFLKTFRMLRVNDLSSPHAAWYGLALGPGRDLRRIRGPREFNEILVLDGTEPAAHAKPLFETYLDITYPQDVAYQRVASASEIRWVTTRTPEQEAARSAVIEKFGSAIRPIEPVASGDSATAEGWTVIDRRLVRHPLTVKDANVADGYVIEAKDLPSPVAR